MKPEERLTERLTNGVIRRGAVTDDNRGETIMSRLAAYEDLGAVEELSALKANYDALCKTNADNVADSLKWHERCQDLCAIKGKLGAENDKLKAENELLKSKKDVLHSLQNHDGKVDMSVSGYTFNFLLAALVESVRANGGKNFLTFEVSDKSNKYAVTIQNCNGTDTPAAKLDRLKAENERLKKQLENAVALPCKVGDTVWINYLYEGQYENEKIFEKGCVDSILYYKNISNGNFEQIEIIISSDNCCLKCTPNDARIWWYISTKEAAEARLKELEARNA